jgi:hypothetical protein
LFKKETRTHQRTHPHTHTHGEGIRGYKMLSVGVIGDGQCAALDSSSSNVYDRKQSQCYYSSSFLLFFLLLLSDRFVSVERICKPSFSTVHRHVNVKFIFRVSTVYPSAWTDAAAAEAEPSRRSHNCQPRRNQKFIGKARQGKTSAADL